ncbi:Double sensory domain of two-component sensor kinase [uncultured archaeon]|nr:Double sensory domain of two-component sensor kinase [uncultured archaeon]
MRISIKFKLLPIIIIGLALLTGLFYYSFLNAQENIQRSVSDDNIKLSKKIFYNIEDNDIKMLSSTLQALLTNKELRDVYLTNNREAVYNYAQPIYSQQKDQFGITHFYIHYPNGTNFIRIHSKAQYGDNITRKTFEKSVQTKGFGSGLELGATAFALRVVHPWYNGTELIGYIELGEEIGHFLKSMKTQTGNEYGIFIKKEFIQHDAWKSMRDSQGLRDNYDDLKDYVVIDTTTESIANFASNSEDKLSKVSDAGETLDKFKIGGNTYVTGGFPLYDAGGNAVGTVLVVKDLTPLENTVNESSSLVLIISIISAIVICLAVVLLVNKYILDPLKNIVEATTKVAGGDFSAEIKPSSDDEIGDLAVMINGFKSILIATAKDLEEVNRRR